MKEIRHLYDLPISALIAAFDQRNLGGASSLDASLASGEVEAWGGTDRPLEWAKEFYSKACKPNLQSGWLPFVSIPTSIQSLLLFAAAETEVKTIGGISEQIGAEIEYWAEVDRDTFIMAQCLVIEAATKKPKLPQSLHSLASKIASGSAPPKKKGDRSWKLTNRNRIGIAALSVLTNPNGFNLLPTKSVASHGFSACDILAEAASGFGWASITPAGADEIWRNRKRWLLEWHLSLFLAIFMGRGGGSIPPDFVLYSLNEMKSTPSGRKPKNQPDEPKG